jgi:hypothetical protein
MADEEEFRQSPWRSLPFASRCLREQAGHEEINPAWSVHRRSDYQQEHDAARSYCVNCGDGHQNCIMVAL